LLPILFSIKKQSCRNSITTSLHYQLHGMIKKIKMEDVKNVERNRDEGGGDDVDGSVVVASDGGDGEGGVEMMPAAGRSWLEVAGEAAAEKEKENGSWRLWTICVKLGKFSQQSNKAINRSSIKILIFDKDDESGDDEDGDEDEEDADS
ncbi:hypothetical protein Tco_1222668, partial [Tanacetum coccineum]